jgi:hypothetical protein
VPPQAPKPDPADWHTSADTGEFTKLFGSGLSGEAIDIAQEQANAARTAINGTRPFQPAGEFTRIFGPEMGGEPSGGAPPAGWLNTSASGLLGGAGNSADAGEYTKVFGGERGPSDGEAAQSPKRAPMIEIPPPTPRIHLGVILGIVAVIVLLAVIVAAVVIASRLH